MILELYANDAGYANASPNLEVNYSALLIIICLMRRKVEERIEARAEAVVRVLAGRERDVCF